MEGKGVELFLLLTLALISHYYLRRITSYLATCSLPCHITSLAAASQTVTSCGAVYCAVEVVSFSGRSVLLFKHLVGMVLSTVVITAAVACCLILNR